MSERKGGLSALLSGLGRQARDELTRARVATRVVRSTGLLDNVRLGGLKALVRSRGRSNTSTLFRYHAENEPHRTALVHRDRAWSFFELNELMDRCAAGLAKAGLRRGDAVVIMLHNAPEFLFLQGGVARLGGAAVSASWRSTAAELAYLVQNSGARALFFAADAAEAVRRAMPEIGPALGGRVYGVGGAVEGFARYEDFLAGASGGEAVSDRSDEASVVIYTSGTTGKPKGAVRKMSRNALVQVLGFIETTPMRVGQTHLVVCPLYHSTAWGFVTISYILASTIVLLDAFEPEAFLDAVERHRVSHTAVVPTMLHRLLQIGEPAIRARDLGSLEAIFTGGAPLSPTLATRVLDVLGDKLFNFYGATETGLVTLATPADLRAAPGTIGRPIPGNELRLYDDRGAEVGGGEVGELYVRSGNLVEGYHANAGATREAMRDGFFSVGDLARCDAAGRFFIEGRKRDMIISGGVNVYPREVESVLTQHPAVAEAAVIGIADEEWGERVHAFVALHRPDVGADELLGFCREHLAGPKRPRGVTILPELPKNPTGKVLKRQLRDLLG
jgi:fatty-acyl-CoA synthase